MTKEQRKEYHKKYYRANKEAVLATINEYNKVNKEAIAAQRKEYYRANKEARLAYAKEHRAANKEYYQGYQNEYYKQRRKTDPLYRLRCNLRSRIREVLKSKGMVKSITTQQMVGCSFEDLKAHIESKMEPWMTWDNHGKYNGTANFGWDIDHMVPVSIAQTVEDIYNLNHWTNLQPLCSYINRDIKKDN